MFEVRVLPPCLCLSLRAAQAVRAAVVELFSVAMASSLFEVESCPAKRAGARMIPVMDRGTCPLEWRSMCASRPVAPYPEVDLGVVQTNPRLCHSDAHLSTANRDRDPGTCLHAKCSVNQASRFNLRSCGP